MSNYIQGNESRRKSNSQGTSHNQNMKVSIKAHFQPSKKRTLDSRFYLQEPKKWSNFFFGQIMPDRVETVSASGDAVRIESLISQAVLII